MDLYEGIRVYFLGSPNNNPDNFIYHYQSLIAGLLAFLAAVFTTWILYRKQNSTLRRRRESYRANLPLALSKLHEYADECLDKLSEALANTDEDENLQRELSIPQLPADSLENISRIIEFGDPRDARYLQALLRKLQVQHARFRSAVASVAPNRSTGRITVAQNLRDHVLDAYVIKTMVDHIYSFARWEIDHIPNYNAETETPGGQLNLESNFDRRTYQYVFERLTRWVARAFSE